MSLKKLTPEEELEFLKKIHGEDYHKLFGAVKDAFALLQSRSQMLLGLATICLTITGFSGPRMAASNSYSRFFIGAGLIFVLSAVIAIVAGPLRLRWMTEWRADTLDETLVEHIKRRGEKTRLYRVGTILLMIGLSGYLISLICYLAVVG